MRQEIRRRGVKVLEELWTHLKDRVRFALGRFARHISLVRVYLRDVNGPRGDLGKKCRMVVELPPRGRVIVASADAAISGAIARSASRAGFAVRRHVNRRRARRRPPRHPARAIGMAAASAHRAAGLPLGTSTSNGRPRGRPQKGGA